jgi:N-acetylmuramoyl-L-alanine amidase
MASYISAGHHLKDSGAVANGYQENELTMEFRDLVVKYCKDLDLRVIVDKDTETLNQYFNRIKPGDGSVVVDFHFDAASPSVSGTTAFVGNSASNDSKAFAKDLSDVVSEVLGIPNRGVKPESESARKSLRIFRVPKGIIALLEICFITNKQDMEVYQKNKEYLAVRIAHVIKKYDDMHG